MQMRYSRGQSIHDACPVQIQASSFDDLVLALERDRSASKDGAAYICGPLAGDGRRCADNVQPVEYLAIDVDRIRADLFPALLVKIQHHNGVWWHTHSSTPRAPRIRILVALSRPAQRAECIHIGAALAHDLELQFGEDIRIDPSTFRPEQPVFVPPVNASLERLMGEVLDVDALLPDVSEIVQRASSGKAAEARNPGENIARGIDLHESLLKLVGAWASRGMRPDEIKCAAIGLLEQARRVRGARVDQVLGPELDRMIDGAVRKFRGEPEPSDLFLDVNTLAKRCDAVRWAVKHVIPTQSVGVIFGASGAFKSFIGLDYSLHRCYGMNWLGKKTRKGRVAYVAAEGGAGLYRRIQAWHQLRGMDLSKCPLLVCITPLTLPGAAQAIRNAVESVQGDPITDIIIDTMSQTYVGNENAADEVAIYFRTLAAEFVKEMGITAIVVHHSGHSATERPRGSSAIIANVDFVFGVFREETELLATMVCLKQKDGERIPDQKFDLSIHEIGKDEDGEPISSLAATHLDSTAKIVEKAKVELKSGRGGRLALFLDIVASGETSENFVRKAFYERLPADMEPEAKRQAYWRATKEASEKGLAAFMDGTIYLSSKVDGEAP